MNPDVQALRIAIVGGGVAGATLFHALQTGHPLLDLHIFEAAADFKQAGLAFSLGRNAQSALELMGPSLVECLDSAGAVPQQGRRTTLVCGPDSGKVVQVVQAGTKKFISVVHRAALLRELMANAPSNRLHSSKKLVEIKHTGDSDSVLLHFEDGSTHECDILIGADGIHSQVRKFVLDDEDPAALPVPASWWHLRTMKSYEESQAIFGKEHVNIDEPYEWGWVGDGAFMMHNILSDGKQVQFVLVGHCDSQDAANNWQRQISSREIEDYFRNTPSFIRDTVGQLLRDQTSHKCLYFWEHLHARSYVKGPVCIAGDAAHSMTPWQASGAAMSVEDSLILSTLLGRAKSPAEARAALQAYDTIRRPRTQRVVESSNGTGLLFTCRDPDVGFDAERLGEKLSTRWDFIRDLDVQAHRDEAIRLMNAALTC